MIRFKALTEEVESEDESRSFVSKKQSTKEAQEAEAFALYNQGLSLLKSGSEDEAKTVFHRLLSFKLLREAAPLTSEDEGLVHPGLVLKYSVYKNLASIDYQNGSHESALNFYIEAVSVDATDVSVWYKIGILALKLNNHMLARFAFEQGLECSPRHWPCLDNIIPVLYSLNNYETCLTYLSKALFRDPGYVKGKAFLHKIFSEQPSLKQDSEHLFKSCDVEIYTKDAETQKGEKFVKDALLLRAKRQELSRVPPLPQVTFTQPLRSLTWKSLGGALISLYDHIAEIKNSNHPRHRDSRVTFGCKVDLSAYQSGSIAQSVALAVEMAPILPALAPQAPLSDPETPTVDEEPPQLFPVSHGDQLTEPMAMDPLPTDTQTDMPMNTQTDSQTDTQMDTQMDAEGNMDSQMDLSQETMQHTGEDGNLSDHIQDSVSGSQPYSGMTPPHSQGSRRGRKRKFHPLGEDYSGKRRSARVRNTVTKKEEAVDFHELFAKFLPITMLEIQEPEEDEESSVPETMETLASQITKADNHHSDQPVIQSLKGTELQDVQDFLCSHHGNSGILDLLNQYLMNLANKGQMLWPEGLSEMYMRAYERFRKHFEYPDYLCKDVPDIRIHDMAMMCLVYMELQLDQWLERRAQSGSYDTSPLKSPGGGCDLSQLLGSDFPGEYFVPDLTYMNGLSVFRDVMGSDWQAYSARVYWLQARFLLLKADMDWAVDCFSRTEEYLKYVVEEDSNQSPLVVSLPNCKHDNSITLGDIEKQRDVLKRCQSLEAIQRLHEAGAYERVIELLLQTFVPVQMPEIHIRERHTQLQDSLLQMSDYKRCLTWSEASLDEAMKKYFAATSMVKQEWLATLCQLMDGINTCFSAHKQDYLAMSSKTMVRLTHNLTRIIQKSMDTPSSAFQMAIPTMLPWILIYRLIKNEEKKRGPMVTRLDENVLPCSLILLNMGHEYLGRRGWCVRCDGSLLLFTVDALMEELGGAMRNEQHPYKEDVEMTLEQAFYCLYAHPNKRTKAKHLEDHNVDQVQLTWERAIPLFEYFKPKSVPEYDSYRASTVSAEQENLLRKISAVIPPHDNPVNTLESVTAYIEGASSEPPSWPEDVPQTMPVVSELYYLLADYYFKNKEPMKAIKFYTSDLCTNPCRFDSWAGMALARASRLEQKLASHEFRPEVSLQRQAICTLRCFKRALQLEATNSKLWIEYGSIAYQLHSFASSQLKQRNWHPFTADQLELAASKKVEMLRLADCCYKKVAEGDGDEMEEQWLPHYMLGKIAEKMAASPGIYLEHYKKASQFLHEDRAKYPKKITFYNNAPHLALESLEMYYRLHVSIIKYLLRHGDEHDLPLDMFERYVTAAAEGPFANCRELKAERKISDRLDANSQDALPSQDTPATMTVATETKKTSTHKAIPDHTYSLEKLTSESSEQSSQESDYRDSSSVFSPSRPRPPSSPASSLGSPHAGHHRGITGSGRSPIPSIRTPLPVATSSSEVPIPVSSQVPSGNLSGSMQRSGSDLTLTSSGLVSSGKSIEESPMLEVTTVSEPAQSQQSMEISLTETAAASSVVKVESMSTFVSPDCAGLDFQTPPVDNDEKPHTSLATVSMTTPALAMSLSAKVEVASTDVKKEPVALPPARRVSSSFSMESILSGTPASSSVRPVKKEEPITPSGPGPLTGSTSALRSDPRLAIGGAIEAILAGAGSAAEKIESPPEPNQPKQEDEHGVVAMDTEPFETLSSPEDQILNVDGTDDTDKDMRGDGSKHEDQGQNHTQQQGNSQGQQQSQSQQKGQGHTQQQDQGQSQHQGQSQQQLQTTESTTLSQEPELPQLDPSTDIITAQSGTGGQVEMETEPLEIGNPGQVGILSQPSMSSVSETAPVKTESSGPVRESYSTELVEDKVPPRDDGEKPKIEETPQSRETPVIKVTSISEEIPVSTVTPAIKERIQEKSKKDEQETAQDKDAKDSSGKAVERETKYRRVMDSCIKALQLCLQRLPQHHKSLYNLAYVYINCSHLKNLEYAQDLLLGNSRWAELSHMPCPGMFHERKQNNFFQGLWKIPIEEIDRSGSFAAHLTSSLVLLFEVLEMRRQSKLLYNIHQQLFRTPDAGKKYIRDSDRVYLAERAFEVCVKVLEVKVMKAPVVVMATEKDPGFSLLMEVYKVWQYGLKQRMDVQRVNKLLGLAFRAAQGGKISDNAKILEEAIKYCQQHQQAPMVSKQPGRIDDPDPRKLTSDSSRRASTGADFGKSQPKTPEAMARARAAEKIRQELLARAKKVSRSPQKSPGMASSSSTSSSPGRRGQSQEELLAQYQQLAQSQQMDMMAALSQLYQQSGYSMAYAASLQAMSQSLYEGYGGFGSPSTSAALDATAASTLMQNAALAAATGMYPYGGYPMLNTETLAALSGLPSASQGLLSPGSMAQALASTQRSPPSSRSPSAQIASTSGKHQTSPLSSKAPSSQGSSMSVKHHSPHSSKAQPSSKPSVPGSGSSARAPSSSKSLGSSSDKVKVSGVPRSTAFVGSPPGKPAGQQLSKMSSPSSSSRSPGHSSTTSHSSVSSKYSSHPSSTTKVTPSHPVVAKVPSQRPSGQSDIPRQIVPGVSTVTQPSHSKAVMQTSGKSQGGLTGTSKSQTPTASVKQQYHTNVPSSQTQHATSSHSSKPASMLNLPKPSPYIPKPLPHHQKVSPHLRKQSRPKPPPSTMQKPSTTSSKASPQYQKALADLQKLAGTITSQQKALSTSSSSSSSRPPAQQPRAPTGSTSQPPHAPTAVPRATSGSPASASRMPAWGALLSGSPRTPVTPSPSKDSVMSLSSETESQDVVIISSSQESDDE